MHLSQKSKNKRFIVGIDYSPAVLHKGSGKEWRIVFYVKNHITGDLERIRKRVKPIEKQSIRLQYANAIIAEINLQLAQGWNPLIHDTNPVSFTLLRDCMQEFLSKISKKVSDKSLRPDTQRAYISYIENIKRFLAYKKLMDMFVINYNKKFTGDFLDWIYYEKGNSPTTHNNHLQFLVVLGNYFIEKEYIPNNPAIAFKKVKQENKIRQTIPADIRLSIKQHLEIANLGYLMLCLLTYHCFIRRTELTKLKVIDINFKKGIIIIPGTASKNRKEQSVTLPETLLFKLVTHVQHAHKDMYLFSGNNFVPGKQQITPKKISDEWTKMRNTLKFAAKYQFYSLKDTGITNMLENGVPSIKVKNQARHSELSTTEKYLPTRYHEMDKTIFKGDDTF